MNEMYAMGILTHNFGVIGLMLVVLINMAMLLRAQEPRSYAKRMRIFMPIGAGMISVILFTGAVMMAAKHLSFTVENLIMIIYGTALIGLEIARYKSLKRLNIKAEGAFETYKLKAFKILQIELIGSLAISIWMWI
jgi:hypothetical protein